MRGDTKRSASGSPLSVYSVIMWTFRRLKEFPLGHLCLGLTFFLSGLCINAIQLLLYLTVRPFSGRLFKRFNYYLHYSISCQILFLAEWWSNSDCRLHCDPSLMAHFGHEHALLIMNHTYEVDWLMGWIIADRCGVLGTAKVYVKDMLRYVPVIGWSWVFSSIVFLRRKWDDDKENIDRQLSVLADYPDPVWLLIFCEGTRFTPAKHVTSMEVARKKGLPELRNLLLPRTKGFTYSASRLRGKFNAVYNLTVCFDTEAGAAPSLGNMLRGKRIVGDMYVERIPMDEVPEEEQEAARWLQDTYRVKDKMMTSYMETGSFSELSGVPQHPVVRLRRRFVSLLNVLAWMWLCLVPLVRRLLALLLFGSWLQAGTVVLVMSILFAGMMKMIALTEISSSSSSYGQADGRKAQ